MASSSSPSSTTAATTGGGGTASGGHSKRPSHLSIDSMGANNAFLHTLNSRLQSAAAANNANSIYGRSNIDSSSDFSLSIAMDRAAFVDPDFDTDEFLSKRSHLPLEELKSQLTAHLKELKAELVELINRDYADFINLSTNLNGVDKMMEDLQRPLDRMKEEATIVEANLQSVVTSLEEKLAHRAVIREKKASLQLLINISESVAKVEGLLQISNVENPNLQNEAESISVAKRLERVAIEYNQMQYLVSKAATLPFVTNIDWRLVRINETMGENLSATLKSCLRTSIVVSSPTSKSESESSSAVKAALVQCMRTYAMIDQTTQAEQVILTDLVEPFVAKVLTKQALEKAYNSSDYSPTRPLVLLYNQILSFIKSSSCWTMMEITQQELKSTDFDIPVHCVWVAVANTLTKNLANNLMGGTRDTFQRNHQDSMNFVNQIEEFCETKRSLQRMRSHPTYQAFMKRWHNQSVIYFQMKFREIAAAIENAFVQSESGQNIMTIVSPKDNTALLPASKAVIASIERCWSKDVYIYSLAHSFWKFTLQLLAVYANWLSTTGLLERTVTADNVPGFDRDRLLQQGRPGSPALSSSNGRNAGRSTPVPGSMSRSGTGTGSGTPIEGYNVNDGDEDESVMRQLTMIVHDIDKVVNTVRDRFEHQIRPLLPNTLSLAAGGVGLSSKDTQSEKGNGEVVVDLVQQSLEEGLASLSRSLPDLQQRITNLLTKRCIDSLKSVIDQVKRITYVRPTEASGFVSKILEPLSQFFIGAGAVLKNDKERQKICTVVVATATTKQYTALMANQLMITKKGDLALQKLVKATKKQTRGGGPAGLLASAGATILGRSNPLLPNAFSNNDMSSGTGNKNGGNGEQEELSSHDLQGLQCLYDVRQYRLELEKFEVDVESFEPYSELRKCTEEFEHLLASSSKP